MELEWKKTCLDAYEAGGELTLTQEETAETIVPDYCPDIARIIGTAGRVELHSREIRDGRGAVSGAVRVTVLYAPDGEGGVRTLDFAMPFTAETDGKALPECAAERGKPVGVSVQIGGAVKFKLGAPGRDQGRKEQQRQQQKFHHGRNVRPFSPAFNRKRGKSSIFLIGKT